MVIIDKNGQNIESNNGENTEPITEQIFYREKKRRIHAHLKASLPFSVFFSHPTTEVRDTPNVRSIPRKLLRSSEARSISSRRSSE